MNRDYCRGAIKKADKMRSIRNIYEVVWGDGSKTPHYAESEFELRKDLVPRAKRLRCTIKSIKFIRQDKMITNLDVGRPADQRRV